MGDHRASIKIKMDFHDVKDEVNTWINYSPTECCNMDSRVIDFFDSVYRRGMSNYDDPMDKIWEEENRQRIEKEEKEEKEELERLKKKYDTEKRRAAKDE